MDGVDRLREDAIHSQATKHLISIGVQKPAQIAGVALSRLEKQDKTRSIAFHETKPWLYYFDGSRLPDERIKQTILYITEARHLKSDGLLYSSSKHRQAGRAGIREY